MGGGVAAWVVVACRIIVSAPVPFPFLWILDLGFGSWIWDLYLGLGFGLDNKTRQNFVCSAKTDAAV